MEWRFPWNALARSNALAAWVERLWRWGSNPLVVSALWAGLAFGLAAAKWLYFTVPWWFIGVTVLFAAYLMAQLFIVLRRAQAIRGIKSIDLGSVAKDCMTFRGDVMEFLVARVDAAPGRSFSRPMGTPEEMHAQWARNVDYSTQTRARSVQRFAHRAIALCHVLETMGVRPPNLWAFDINIAGVAIYVGAVGDLLERGLLHEARSLNPDEYRRLMIHIA